MTQVVTVWLPIVLDSWVQGRGTSFGSLSRDHINHCDRHKAYAIGDAISSLRTVS